MLTEQKISEKDLYKVWLNFDFDSDLRTTSGEKITILDKGVLDIETSGPDFKNAKIKIGNFLFTGDVEVELDYKCWKTHGHNIDRKYSKTILHVCLFNKFNQPYVYSKDGRKIPSLCLEKILDENIINQFSDIDLDSNNKIRCCTEINDEIKYKFLGYLKTLGIERFNKKCDSFLFRMKELKFLDELKIKEPVISYNLRPEFLNRKFEYSDFDDKGLWQQLFYELIFEALGYSKNKLIMQRLAQTADLKFFKKFANSENKRKIIESTLFNVSGLFPEIDTNKEQSEYLLEIKNLWENLSRIYDSEKFDKTDWDFFKLRPHNFPTLRIAAGARIVNELLFNDFIPVIIRKIREINNLKVLINSLRSLFIIKANHYWQKHFIFGKSTKSDIKYLVGATRANEILINVVFPFFALYFDVFGEKGLSKKIIAAYTHIEQNDINSITRKVSKSFGIEEYSKHSIYSQGMILLFRNYCSKGKCLECEMGQIIFN